MSGCEHGKLIVPDLIKQAVLAVKDCQTASNHARHLSLHDYDVITRPFRNEIDRLKAPHEGYVRIEDYKTLNARIATLEAENALLREQRGKLVDHVNKTGSNPDGRDIEWLMQREADEHAIDENRKRSAFMDGDPLGLED